GSAGQARPRAGGRRRRLGAAGQRHPRRTRGGRGPDRSPRRRRGQRHRRPGRGRGRGTHRGGRDLGRCADPQCPRTRSRPRPRGGRLMPYLDHAASAPVDPEVLRAMWPYLAGGPANPSSRHEAGRTAAAALDWARDQIATALGGRPGEVVLTAGGTEADNLAVKGIALARPRGRRILTSPTEHPAVLESCRALARLAGFTVEMLPVDGAGRVRADDVATALDA